MTTSIDDLTEVFETESKFLDAALRQHPRLRPLFERRFEGSDLTELKESYMQLLKLEIDYVQYTTPALRAAGETMRAGDEEDRRWGELLLEYASDETDQEGDYGHQVWARNDMIALGAPKKIIDAPTHLRAEQYGKYFIDYVEHHPYAILGAKGVLEHFSILVSDDLVRGIVASGIPGAENATTFFSHHGALDIDHVREGDRNISGLVQPHKRQQVLEGVYFSSGAYRSLLHSLLPHCSRWRLSTPSGSIDAGTTPQAAE